MASSDRATEAACRETAEYVRSQMADAVRGVFYYDRSESKVVYLRDDVRDHYEGSRAERVLDDLVLESVGDPPRLEGLYPMGEMRSTVRRFEEGFLVHVLVESGAGIAVTVGEQAADDICRLLDVFEERLREACPS